MCFGSPTGSWPQVKKNSFILSLSLSWVTVYVKLPYQLFQCLWYCFWLSRLIHFSPLIYLMRQWKQSLSFSFLISNCAKVCKLWTQIQFLVPLFPRLCKVCLEIQHSHWPNSVCCLFPFLPLLPHAPSSAVGLALLTTISATECQGQAQRVTSHPIHFLMDWNPFIRFSAGWCPEIFGSC